jgi:long-chain acyl-CoA synthetase
MRPKAELSFDDVAMYQYTGGTTGVSKGVMLTHGNLSRQVQQIGGLVSRLRLRRNHAGRTALFPRLRFDHGHEPGHLFQLGQHPGTQTPAATAAGGNLQVQPTFAPLVPTMYIGMLNIPDIEKADLTSIKGCFSGSAPLPVGGHQGI